MQSVAHLVPSSEDLAGDNRNHLHELGKAVLVKRRGVNSGADSCSSSFLPFYEESREYGNSLKLLKHRVSIRVKNLLLLLISNRKKY